MIQKFVGLAAMALFATGCAQQSAEMTLETLLERHAVARGGASAIESVHAIEIGVLLVEPDFTLNGRYVATRDNWMRVDVFDGDTRVFTEAVGPDGEWQMFGDGEIADVSGDGYQALMRGVAGNLYGLHELETLGYDLTLAGEAARNGAVFWEIESIAPEGFTEHVFIDRGTYLIASKVETSALHPDLDPEKTRQETFYSDYQPTNGVLFARKTVKKDIESGDILQETTANEIAVNTSPDASQFNRPAR